MRVDHSLTAKSLLPAVERLFTLSAAKIRDLDKTSSHLSSSPVFTVQGKYTSRGWTEWTQGFQFGSSILQFDATGEHEFLESGRANTLRYMAPHVSHIGVHDHGFNNVSTYGNLRRLMLEGRIPADEWERNFYELALKLSGAIQAARWTQLTPDLGYCYSFNGPHSLFSDTIRSMRALVISHQLGHQLMGEKDVRINLLSRALQHAEATARYNVYFGLGRDSYDVRGRVVHESIFNTNDGSYRCPSTQQGYSPFSTWTRGQAWIVCGYAEQLEFLLTLPDAAFDGLGGKQPILERFEEVAGAVCDFWIAHTPTDGIPYWDTGAPDLHKLGDWAARPSDPYNDHEPVDSSAAAIAACGLIRYGNYLRSTDRTDLGARYYQAGLTIAEHLFAEPYLSTPPTHQGLILHSVYHRPNGWDYIPPGQKVPCGESSMWGDYHARELALMLLREARQLPYYSFFATLCLFLFAVIGIGRAQQPAAAPTSPPAFDVVEATIAQTQDAMKSGRLTCRQLVAAYLRRIDAYDKNGPALNSIVVINPEVEKEAAELDRRFAQSGPAGPLHCVPVIVKDNFETKGLQTADGALAFANYLPEKDAFQVQRLKEAGALVLAKSNMAEWAFSPYETVNSILPGYTRNPYALNRVTAGSSGGTAASIAASFGLVGMGSDTGNSIRGPSSHQALVGIRSTMGLTSRTGVFPLSLLADIAGPMARTVEDAARVFQVIVGEDPADAVTAAAKDHPPQNYLAALDRNGLRGATIGVLRAAYERPSTDPEIVAVFQAALEDMKRAGASIVDPANIDGLNAINRPRGSGPCMGFKYDLNRFLAARGNSVPLHNLAEILRSNRFHPNNQARLESAEKGPENGPETPACQADAAYRKQVGEAVIKTMDRLKLDAFVYPTWSNPPRLIGDLNTPAGDNSQFYSPTTGFPAINVPMGYTRGGQLPAGMTIYGRPWSEAELIKLAYAYEQDTHRRHAPASTPPLR